MKSKLYVLLALLALTAVFASPALAVPAHFTSPAGGSTISTPTDIVVTTDTPVVSVEILDGTMTSLGFATADGLQTTWTFELDPALRPAGALFLNARSTDGIGTQELASPARTFTVAHTPAVTWVSPASANMRQPDALQITTDGTETNVQFSFRGSALIGTITESPANTYTMAFDPDDYANGLGDLRADVTNANGTTQKIYGVDIDNLSDDPNWNAPSVDGQEIGISSGLLLQAGTSIEYDGVEFFLDENPIGQAVEEGGLDTNDWRFQFDTSGYTLGAHVLTAVSQNGTLFSAGNDRNVVFVDDIDPAISSYSPVDGSAVSGSFTFTVTATDNVAATSATFWLNEGTPAAMTAAGGGVFTATVNVSAVPNGLAFLYTEVKDARNNVAPGNTSINVANPQAPTLNTGELEYYGSTQVGSEGMNAFGATATGTPAPTVSYSWRVCEGVSCNNYAGATYSPIAADVGRTVELVVRASNGVNPQDTEIVSVGTVTAADPEPTPEPSPPPPPPPAPSPVVTPPVVVPPTTVPPATVPPATVPPVVVKTPITIIAKTGAADQKISGTSGPDRIVTGKGNDVIRTGAGADVISPGKGGGLVYAGAGNDKVNALLSKNLVVNCGAGKDTLFANRSTQSVGCEKVVVSSNNKLVEVKVGADKLPVMPANFISPNAPTQKAPAVVEAEKKAAEAAATVVETKKKAAEAKANADAAAKEAVAAKAKADAAAKLEAAATAKAKADVAAKVAQQVALDKLSKSGASPSQIAAERKKLAAAAAAAKAAKEALAAAVVQSNVADKKLLTNNAVSVVSAEKAVPAAVKSVVAAAAQVEAAKAVVATQVKIVAAFDAAVEAKAVAVVKATEAVKEITVEIKETASPVKKAELKDDLAEALSKKQEAELKKLDGKKKLTAQEQLLKDQAAKVKLAEDLKKLEEERARIAKVNAAQTNAAHPPVTRATGKKG